MKQIIATVMAFSFFGFLSCSGRNSDLNPDMFSESIENSDDIRVIDVRTASEYEEGHLQCAVNIDWQSEGFLDKVRETFDKKAPLHVYCRSGRRSAEAADALSKEGYEVINLEGGYTAWTGAGKPVTLYQVMTFGADDGSQVNITFIKHASLCIRYRKLSIQIDPVTEHGKHTDYATEFPKADAIFVTHEHGDHMDNGAITALMNTKTVLYVNGKVHDAIGKGSVMTNGQSVSLPEGIKVDAVPAYNTTPGRENFHPKGNGNGYVFTINGLRVYVAGDTEDVPEMSDLKDIDVAFLPVNQPYTMTVDQCVKAAKVIRPKVLIPYHYSQTDLSPIPGQLPEIDVRMVK